MNFELALEKVRSPHVRAALRHVMSIGPVYPGAVHDANLVSRRLRPLSACLSEVRSKAEHLLSDEVFVGMAEEEKVLLAALRAYEAAGVACPGGRSESVCEVVNLTTGQSSFYSCPPNEAVVCAFEQSRRNWSTWTYDYGKAQLSPSGRTWSCGDFVAAADDVKPSVANSVESCVSLSARD